MKVFALTLLGLVALAQARIDYKIQCTQDEVGIRWPSYHSNSEYYVCQHVYGGQLTVHCPPGEVFTFVMQQCTVPALYVPPPVMDRLPTSGSITTHLVEEVPPMISEHLPHHPNHELVDPLVDLALPADPTPPTPAAAQPTPPVVAVEAPIPGKRPAVPAPPSMPMPPRPASGKKSPVPTPGKSAANKQSAPAPSKGKSAKKPAPPSKAAKKPSA
ncbi:CG7715 [Drosophila busckii]|uniref:CG7715 n=1 Tax=Drosophila busckii TaxID=30019 RepID=A0A0M4F264_DROBS|nr:vegetative cell wall protein gp1 [Drosophila busckii]ALC45475.1 CG7715 [Drosophila busckii]